MQFSGRFLRPKSGRITFGGRDIYDMPEREFRQAIGIVFQDLYLFPHMTVLQNMTLAPTKVLGAELSEAERDARAVLERLGSCWTSPHPLSTLRLLTSSRSGWWN